MSSSSVRCCALPTSRLHRSGSPSSSTRAVSSASARRTSVCGLAEPFPDSRRCGGPRRGGRRCGRLRERKMPLLQKQKKRRKSRPGPRPWRREKTQTKIGRATAASPAVAARPRPPPAEPETSSSRKNLFAFCQLPGLMIYRIIVWRVAMLVQILFVALLGVSAANEDGAEYCE